MDLIEHLTNAYLTLLERETNLRPLVTFCNLQIVRVVRGIRPLLRIEFFRRTIIQDARLRTLVLELRRLRRERDQLMTELMTVALSFSDALVDAEMLEEMDVEDFLEDLEEEEQ